MLRSIFVTMYLLLMISSVSYGQIFESTSGPYGGDVNCYAQNSAGTIYAGTWSGGVFASADSGISWDPIGLTGISVWSLVVANTGQIFAGTDGQGVFRSDAQGSWTQVAENLPYHTVRFIAINPVNNQLFIMAEEFLNGMSYYRSTDLGVSWTAINDGLPSILYTEGLGIAPNGDLYTGGFGAVYRLPNNGTAWAVTGTTGNFSFDCFAFSGNTIYAAGSQVISSTNNGQSWTQIGTVPIGSFVYGIDRTPNGNVYLATVRGMLRRTGNNNTWTNIGLYDHNLYAVYAKSNNFILAGTRSDASMRSTDDSNWLRSPGITALFHLKIAAYDTTLYTATTEGVYRATDGYAEWMKLTPPKRDLYCFDISSSGSLLCGTDTSIIRSSNRGATWVRTGPADSTFVAFTKSPVLTNMYAATKHSLYRSTNDGVNWTMVAQTGNNIQSLEVVPVPGGGYKILVTTDNGVYTCNADGSGWISAGLTGINVYRSLLSTSGILMAATENGLYRVTIDSIPNWQLSNYAGSVYSLGNFTTSILFTTELGLMRTDDHGTTWSAFSDGLPSNATTAFEHFLPTDKLYVGNVGCSVYRQIQPNSVPATSSGAILPNGILLRQNYPNPFNPTTTIAFELPKNANTRVEIFNSTGQLVESIASEIMTAGHHEFHWNGSNQPSGVYWCKVTSGNLSSARRMVLVK